MKWQKLLTKTQLAHLRWSRDGNTPTLQSFIQLRKSQAELKVKRAAMKLYAPLCGECDEIEARLKSGGKL